MIIKIPSTAITLELAVLIVTERIGKFCKKPADPGRNMLTDTGHANPNGYRKAAILIHGGVMLAVLIYGDIYITVSAPAHIQLMRVEILI